MNNICDSPECSKPHTKRVDIHDITSGSLANTFKFCLFCAETYKPSRDCLKAVSNTSTIR
jgi:hypothetical protein